MLPSCVRRALLHLARSATAALRMPRVRSSLPATAFHQLARLDGAALDRHCCLVPLDQRELEELASGPMFHAVIPSGTRLSLLTRVPCASPLLGARAATEASSLVPLPPAAVNDTCSRRGTVCDTLGRELAVGDSQAARGSKRALRAWAPVGESQELCMIAYERRLAFHFGAPVCGRR